MDLLLMVLGSVMLATAGDEPQDGRSSSCVTCHAKEAESDHDSVHAHNGVSCTDCHGGDATQSDKAKAKDPATGYRGKIARAAIPELCGSCHADVRRMNPFGLPTDQLARYRASHHGEALAKGDVDVATCADCHQAHGTRSPRDPQSPVYAKNVPATCGRCHSDEQKMGAHELKANQEALYRKSIHAQMLLEKGDLSAPTCVTCHGSHGAVPPGFAKVGLVCGKCHVKQKEFFDLGPHRVPAQEGTFETCVACHSNHKVMPASEALYGACKKCHDEGDQARVTLAAVLDLMTTSRARYEQVAGDVAAASRAGFAVEEEQVSVGEAKTYLLQLGPMQHALDLSKLREVSGEIGRVLTGVSGSLADKRVAEQNRKRALIPIAVFLIAMSALFSLMHRRVVKARIASQRAGGAPR